DLRGRGGNLAHAVAVVVAVVVRDRREGGLQVAALLPVVRDPLERLRGGEVLLLVALVRLGGGQERLKERRDARGLLGGERLTLVLVAHVLRSEEHTSELQSRENLVCRLLLEKKKNKKIASKPR